MDSVENEPHLKGLIQHPAGRLAVPGASAAAEVEVPRDSGSDMTAMSEELVEAVRGQPGMAQTALRQAFVGHAHALVSAPLNDRNTTRTSPVYHSVYRAPWGGAMCHHRTEDAER